MKGKGDQIDLETGEIGIHATPTIVKDVAIVGSSFREGATVLEIFAMLRSPALLM